jgi:hypothetical protein
LPSLSFPVLPPFPASSYFPSHLQIVGLIEGVHCSDAARQLDVGPRVEVGEPALFREGKGLREGEGGGGGRNGGGEGRGRVWEGAVGWFARVFIGMGGLKRRERERAKGARSAGSMLVPPVAFESLNV